MYSNAGYLSPEEAKIYAPGDRTRFFHQEYRSPEQTSLEDLTCPLRINSCGVTRLLTVHPVKVYRPRGREDYQLIYIASGQVHFFFDNTETIVTAGHMVLYRPGEIQYYVAYSEESPESYWVHFTGYDVEKLVDFFPRNGSASILSCGISPHYQEIYQQMIRELQLFRPEFSNFLALLFQQLLVQVKRHITESSAKNSRMSHEIQQAILYFNENMTSDIVIADYAKKHHMSISWFIQNFRQQVGISPLKYLTTLKINRAKEFLESDEYTISEICSIIGYKDPLYFSKLFKKATGLSPSEYKKTLYKTP